MNENSLPTENQGQVVVRNEAINDVAPQTEKSVQSIRNVVRLLFYTIGGISIAIVLIAGITALFHPKQQENVNTYTRIVTNQKMAPMSPVQQRMLTNTPTLLPTATPIPFDQTKGNNAFAAQYAQKIINAFTNTLPGVVKNVYVETNPSDMQGKSINDYQKIISSVSLTMQVNATAWENTGDSEKKDLVALLITTTHQNINVYPDVTISNGIRTVAKGSWSAVNGEADITLQ